MFILGDIIITLANILHAVLQFYQFVLFASVIISWVRPQATNDVIRQILHVIVRLTDPVFYEIRKRLPQSFFSSGLDFTPMIAWLAVMAIDTFIYRVLTNIGLRLSHGI